MNIDVVQTVVREYLLSLTLAQCVNVLGDLFEDFCIRQDGEYFVVDQTIWPKSKVQSYVSYYIDWLKLSQAEVVFKQHLS